MPGVRKAFHPKRTTEQASKHSYGGKTVQMLGMWEKLHLEDKFRETPEDSHGGKAL